MAILHDLIQKSRMAEYCLVSSFDHDVLREMKSLNAEYIQDQSNKLETSSILSLMSRQSQFQQHPLNVATLYLHNFYHYYKRSPNNEMITQGCGGNLQLHDIDSEMVKEMHKSGKIVSVWIDATAPYKEDVAFYEKVYEL